MRRATLRCIVFLPSLICPRRLAQRTDFVKFCLSRTRRREHRVRRRGVVRAALASFVVTYIDCFHRERV